MIFGRNSTTVTSAPRRDQTEPSSTPDDAAADDHELLRHGRGKAMAWSLETTVLPSNFMNGSSTGAEPVAMTMFLAVSSVTGRLLALDSDGGWRR
jgi:hypothetical protein